MEAMEAILTRKSIRNYSQAPISDEHIDMILRAGMSGPSCTNARDWAFLVARDKATLSRMADANGAPGAPLKRASLAILICGDLDRAFPPAKEYWVIDGAIAAQNMTLAAHSLGIGSVWLGTWPQMDRVERQRELFHLPESMIPHSILAMGYPADSDAPDPEPRRPVSAKPKWEPDRIHYETW